MQETWLHALMKEHQIAAQDYDFIHELLICTTTDMAEKCELLLDFIVNEQFVRQVLELLELKTVDSLVNPQNHSHAIHKKTKQIESLVTETDNDIPEGVDQFNPFTPEEMLCQVFSNIDVNRIHQVLETCNYNIEDAMDSLLNKQVEKPKQVCRHFMVGNCYRSDCWFSHDPDALLCKFWIKGRCNKGDNCEFSHGQAIELKKVEAEPIAKTPPPKMDDFPVLGQVRQKIDFLAPVNYNNVLLKPVEKTNIQKVRESQKKTKVDVQWVSTGDSLASSYFKFRGDAIDAALNRNRLFQRATEAYLSGNKAAARALSLAAQQLNTQVVELHNEAASKIFKERNKSMTKDGKAMIDLHGLHPLEAIDKLDEAMLGLKRKKYLGKVIVITGTGHHSRGQSKVLPAIRDHLQRSGTRYKDATLEDNRGGVLILEIK